MAAEGIALTHAGGVPWAGPALQSHPSGQGTALIPPAPAWPLNRGSGQQPKPQELQLCYPSLSREPLHCPAWAALLQAPSPKGAGSAWRI